MTNNFGNKYSVLIFEDDFALALEWKEALTEIGLHVEHSWDIKDALNLCKQKKFDIILCDIFIKDNKGKLKSEGGISFILRLRRQSQGLPSWGKDVPILVVTGVSINFGPNVHDNINNMNTSLMMKKPFTYKELIEKMQEIILEIESKKNDNG